MEKSTLSNQVNKFYEDERVKHQLIIRHALEQNGVSEKKKKKIRQ